MGHIIRKPVKVTRYHRLALLVTVAAVITSLYLLSRHNYLYFHILLEMFSIFIAYTIFAVTWKILPHLQRKLQIWPAACWISLK